ncbi:MULTISPECIES: SRPBCC family protein [Roseomonadaceae]|uniref:SRPBCC family protein n=1 Tax=Falsiroseomonas oleicola TaxID=2801474 RepID=A0ABS6H935_9PROT|nr:SRPBCC family protein [Roseomonas oleicola]MBU8545208.1 SRPBCC family protein [Roseomonas oleicola]
MADESPLDLVLTRIVPVPPRLVWLAWTRPEHLVKWFTPAPWRTTAAEIDLRPGGIFRTVMEGPNGERMDSPGCWLEVEEERRLTFTDALLPGFRPAPEPFFTATITLEPVEGGTRYTALAMHRTPEDRDRHAAMGFHQGWGTALDQLVATMRGFEG